MNNLTLLSFLVLPLFGWLAVRTILNVSSIVYLIPFSWIFGVASFLTLLYSFAYFIGVQKAALLALCILFLLSILLVVYFKEKIIRLESSLTFKEIVVVFGLSFLISILTYSLLTKWHIWDFEYHVSEAILFASKDKFPTGTYAWPSIFIPYHYGFDILSASISKIGNISMVNAFNLIVVISVMTTVFACFTFAYFFDQRKSFLTSLFAGLGFYFAGGLLWLDSFIRYLLKIYPVTKDWSFFKTFCAVGLHGSYMNDMGSGGIMFASLTLGVQLFILLIFIYFNFIQDKSLNYFYMLPFLITSIALFHCAEWIIYIFITSLILSSIVSFFLRNTLDWKSLIIKNIFCCIGIVAFMLFNSLAASYISKDFNYVPNFFTYALKANILQFEVFGRFGDLNQHRLVSFFSWDFVSELGIQFLLLMFVFVWLLKNKFSWAPFIISFIIVSFAVPFCIVITTSPPDILRMYHPAFEIISMLFILWSRDFAGSFKLPFLKKLIPVIFSFFVIVQPVCKLTLSSVFGPPIYLGHEYIDLVDNSIKRFINDHDFKYFSNTVGDLVRALNIGIFGNDYKVTQFLLKEQSKYNGYGLSLNHLPFSFAGIPCYSISGSSLSKKITFITLLQTLDPYLIKELKIKWLFLDTRTAQFTKLSVIEDLINRNFLKLVFEVDDKYVPNVRAGLLRFIDSDRYFKTYPRKTYWTYHIYSGDNIITFPSSSGKEVIYLFKSENEAVVFLKQLLELNTQLKNANPAVDAFSEDTLKEQANKNNCVLRYI